MTLLILDTEPTWLAHWTAQGIPAGQASVVILNARHLEMIPVLVKAGATVIVASSLPSVNEAIAAYRGGATGYVAEDLGMTAGDVGAPPVTAEQGALW